MKNITTTLRVLALGFITSLALAQETPDVHLHVNPKWEECSIQIDPNLSQEAWHQFAKEAALVTYFRPLNGAKPMGRGTYELSLLQWNTAINETHEAWNNTFVHPDSAHWLVGGHSLPFPGLTLRSGITKRIDAAVYFTQNPGANYGFIGGQLQYNLVNDTTKGVAVSTRANFVSSFGPEDLNLKSYGLDVVASKQINIYSDKISVSPYITASSFLSHAHEKTDKVSLKDEIVPGLQAAVGASARVSILTLGVEYNFAKINTLSYKMGITYNFNRKNR